MKNLPTLEDSDMDRIITLSVVRDTAEFPFDYHEIASEDHFWFQWRFRVILKQWRQTGTIPAGPRILDLGCGNGSVRRQIEKQNNWITDGMDVDKSALQRNVGLRGNTYLYDINERRAEFRNSYDIILLLDVLEHVHDRTRFLESALHMLKPGGYLIINVPAFELLRSHYDKVQGHIKRYTKKTLTDEFQNLPIKIQWMNYWGGILVPLLILRKIMFVFFTPANVTKSGFEPPLRILHRILKGLMIIETSLFNRLPFGSSLLAILTKE